MGGKESQSCAVTSTRRSSCARRRRRRAIPLSSSTGPPAPSRQAVAVWVAHAVLTVCRELHLY